MILGQKRLGKQCRLLKQSDQGLHCLPFCQEWYRIHLKNVLLTNDEDIDAVKVEVVDIDYGNSRLLYLIGKW